MTTPEFHTVELDLPLDVADELIARAGSVDAAVVRALQEYLKTDYDQRAKIIKHVRSTGKSIESIAVIYAMSEADIEAIINS
jgi:ABC-type ATPase with predicted acetyltransferase domain